MSRTDGGTPPCMEPCQAPVHQTTAQTTKETSGETDTESTDESSREGGTMDSVTLEDEGIEDTTEGTEIASKGTFPLDTLPFVLKHYVIEAARSLSVAPEMVVLPLLTTVGAAIGNSRTIQLKAAYQESAAIYGAVVADTGSMKSPSLAIAVKPLQDLEIITRRTWTSDTTVEALGPLLAANPRGLIVVKDELSGLVTGLNQYKRGKGNDRQFYLSAYSGSALRVDRKGGSGFDPLALSIAKPFLSVIGCIPPDVLPSLKADHDADDGFLERLLFAWPTPIPVRWSEATISHATMAGYSGLIQQLVEIDWPGSPTPLPLPLTPEAQLFWREWHDQHMQEAETVSPRLRGFYSKFKGYCARLALIHTLASNSAAEEVTVDSLQSAAAQIEYFKCETIKVVNHLCLSVGNHTHEVEKARKVILKAVQKQGNSGITRRDVQRLQNCNAFTFGIAWDSLTIPPLFLIPGGGGKYILNSCYRQTDNE